VRAPALEQVFADAAPNRARAVQLDRVEATDLGDPEAAQSFKPILPRGDVSRRALDPAEHASGDRAARTDVPDEDPEHNFRCGGLIDRAGPVP
jgi:hypothetical protein